MKQIAIQELRVQLSAIIAEAESGQTILITRHNRAVARLTPPVVEHTHAAKRRGIGKPKPLLKRATQGRYLTVLLEDRGGSR
jgi:prevent-host-death family protein